MYLWIVCLALALSGRAAEIRFNFGNDAVGSTPTNFTAVLVGRGQPGVWKIITEKTPSAFAPFAGQTPDYNLSSVLAQTGQDMTDEHFPLFVYQGETFRNFKFTTRLKILSGIVEQMAGVVFRYQNASNYYVVRASALGKNVRFYKVVDGIRSDPIGPNLDVTTEAWHTLAVQCDGNQISIWWDDQLILPPLGDNSFSQGRLGFCTKSDAVACFTDATVNYTPILPGAQLLVNRITQEQTRLLDLRIYTLQTNATTQVIASKDREEIGMAGTAAELKAIQDGAVSFGREKDAVLVTLPLHDRNGDYIAAVRVRLKSFWGETEDNAVARARQIVKQMQAQVLSKNDLL
jgi:hypothetical protein